MNSKTQKLLLRLLVHGLLAIFLANAANKFFVVDLDYEAEHQFYAKIFAGLGDAPDQYRILPLLPLKWLCSQLPFNQAVMVYNLGFGFLAFELFAWIMGGIRQRKKFTFNILFAGAYIYAQYTGWRPDTMGLVFLSAFMVSPLFICKARSQLTLTGALGMSVLMAALAFSRADIAMVFAFYLGIYHAQNWFFRILWVVLPVLVQYLLMIQLYPEASYYSDKVMLLDNLSGYYLLRHPGTYLLLALGCVYFRPIQRFIRQTWDQKWFYVLCLAYLGLVLVVGRVNEYRLYLPFVPIFADLAASYDYAWHRN